MFHMVKRMERFEKFLFMLTFLFAAIMAMSLELLVLSNWNYAQQNPLSGYTPLEVHTILIAISMLVILMFISAIAYTLAFAIEIIYSKANISVS